MDINEILIPETAIKAIEEGHWVEDIPNAPGLRLRVRGLSSRKVLGLHDLKIRKAPRTDKNADGSLKSEASLRITREVYAEAVLLEWDGITANGKPVPYSKEMAKKWLSDRSGDNFMRFVTYAANEVDELQNETAESLEKN